MSVEETGSDTSVSASVASVLLRLSCQRSVLTLYTTHHVNSFVNTPWQPAPNSPDSARSVNSSEHQRDILGPPAALRKAKRFPYRVRDATGATP